MVGGFSFCGVDIADLGLEYAPDNANTYVIKPTKSKIHEQVFDGHHGGVYYGSTKQPKDFALRCFYEGQNIHDGILTCIYSLFTTGRTGRLVFQKSPWCYYNATVIDVDTSQMFNFLNGCVIIRLRAYHPFALSDLTNISNKDEYDINVCDNTALLYENISMPPVQLASETSITEQTSFIVYNGGTETATVAIEIAGEATGVTIANKTTGQACKFINLKKQQTSDEGKYIVSDGMTGKTIITNGTTSELAFLYHDYGFIELAPAFPILRDVLVKYSSGNTQVLIQDSSLVLSDVIGQYVFVDKKWRRIVNQEGNELTVTPSCDNDGSENASIVRMNEITVTPDETMEITKLNIVYKPTFS